MKKLLCLLLCLLLPLAALAEEIPPLTADDFILTVGETTYALGEEPTALVAALEALIGAPLAMTESISCMFDGMDREFAREDEDGNVLLLVGTYPIGPNKGDVIESVTVAIDALTTARGAAVGMTKEDIEALYGTDYFLDWDTMIYSLGELEPELMFRFDPETGVITDWMMRRNAVV